MNLASFDLNLLKVLDALLREGSVTRAGERVGLSQPAVSAALQRIRAALGDEILVRQGQRLVPTDFARDLAVPLRQHLEGLEQLLSAAARFDPSTAEATFRLAGADFFGDLLMPRLVSRLRLDAPGIRLQLVDLVPDGYMETLERSVVDVTFLPRTQFPDWVEYRPVFHSSYAVVARAGHPAIAAAGVAEGTALPLDLFCGIEHILMSPEGKFRGQADTALETVGRSRKVVMTMPFFGGICRAVAGSDLIALVPQQMARRMAKVVDLGLYLPPVLIEPSLICMVWHRRADANPALRWLRGIMAEILEPLNAGEMPLPAAAPLQRGGGNAT